MEKRELKREDKVKYIKKVLPKKEVTRPRGTPAEVKKVGHGCIPSSGD